MMLLVNEGPEMDAKSWITIINFIKFKEKVFFTSILNSLNKEYYDYQDNRVDPLRRGWEHEFRSYLENNPDKLGKLVFEKLDSIYYIHDTTGELTQK